MKKMLVLLGLLTTMFIGSQSFAACPCSGAFTTYSYIPACPCHQVVKPCCQEALPCPACPVANSCCDSCNSCCDSCGCGCRKKCSWWKFWENKDCCYKCNKCDCCDKCDKCNDCCD